MAEQGSFTLSDAMRNVPGITRIPGAAWNEPLAPSSVLTARPVDSATYDGSPHVDYDNADQQSLTGRVEHDVTRGWTVRHQARYNQTSREAVVAAISSVASFNPATEQVTFARQINGRDNSILSNQTSLVGRLTTGTASHAIRQVTGTAHRIRTDLSCTLFLSGPDEYQGGELMVEDTYGVHSVKLPAGDLVLYPSTSLHHVRPVTSSARTCPFFWLQSMVRSDADRTLLFDLDAAIRSLHGLGGTAPPPCSSPACITTCCVAGRRSEPDTT